MSTTFTIVKECDVKSLEGCHRVSPMVGPTFDEYAFEKAFEKLGEAADFVVVPDIVCGGQITQLQGMCSH